MEEGPVNAQIAQPLDGSHLPLVAIKVEPVPHKPGLRAGTRRLRRPLVRATSSSRRRRGPCACRMAAMATTRTAMSGSSDRCRPRTAALVQPHQLVRPELAHLHHTQCTYMRPQSQKRVPMVQRGARARVSRWCSGECVHAVVCSEFAHLARVGLAHPRGEAHVREAVAQDGLALAAEEGLEQSRAHGIPACVHAREREITSRGGAWWACTAGEIAGESRVKTFGVPRHAGDCELAKTVAYWKTSEAPSQMAHCRPSSALSTCAALFASSAAASTGYAYTPNARDTTRGSAALPTLPPLLLPPAMIGGSAEACAHASRASRPRSGCHKSSSSQNSSHVDAAPA